MTDRPDPFNEIEQLFDQFSQFSAPLGERVPVDVIDTEDTLIVHADLPGRDPDSITVQLEDNRNLHIETEPPESTPEGRYITRERERESVSRSVTLPAAVDESATDADYERGVLTVYLPKMTGDSDGTDIPVS